jgi:uncharacterized protein YdaU (DUF1376 family)
MSGVARFDCYPSDLLNGLIGMTADQIAVYTVVLLLQYDRGEPVLLEGRERELAIRAGLTRGRLDKAVADLLRLGKLQSNCGRIWNKRASEELAKIRERIAKNRENSERGGNATRQKFEEKTKENNEDIGPTGQPSGQPSGRPYSPPPLPPLEDTYSERARETDFRSAISDLYQRHGYMPPETGTGVVWLKQGRDPDICLAVIDDHCAGRARACR